MAPRPLVENFLWNPFPWGLREILTVAHIETISDLCYRGYWSSGWLEGVAPGSYGPISHFLCGTLQQGAADTKSSGLPEHGLPQVYSTGGCCIRRLESIYSQIMPAEHSWTGLFWEASSQEAAAWVNRQPGRHCTHIYIHMCICIYIYMYICVH